MRQECKSSTRVVKTIDKIAQHPQACNISVNNSCNCMGLWSCLVVRVTSGKPAFAESAGQVSQNACTPAELHAIMDFFCCFTKRFCCQQEGQVSSAVTSQRSRTTQEQTTRCKGRVLICNPSTQDWWQQLESTSMLATDNKKL